MQKRTISGSKNCHNSDLNFTNCKAFAKIWGNLLLKTRWKLFNSTRKTGAAAGLLHIFHRVFNLWKNCRLFTECIGAFCGKLFALAKQRKCAVLPGQRAKHFYSCPVRRGSCVLLKKFQVSENKIPAICGEAGRDMVYFILDYHKQNKTFRCGAARPERKEHKKDGRT